MANTARDLIKCRISNTPGTSGNFTLSTAFTNSLLPAAADDGLAFKLNITENGVGTEIRRNCTYTHSTTTFGRGTMVRSTAAADAALDFTAAAIVSVVPSAEDYLTTVSASYFGISASNADNTAGFAAMGDYIQSVVNFAANGPTVTGSETVEITLPVGILYVDGAKMDLTYVGTGAYTPRFILRGAGKGITIIQSKSDSTAAAVLELACGYAANVLMEDFSVQTRSDTVQDGVHIYATRRTLDDTGGITDLTVNRVGVRSYLGDAVVFSGGDDYLGPNQFITLGMCTWQADVGSSIKTLGQFGQLNVINGDYSAVLDSSACPAMDFSKDYRQTIAPSAADTTSNFVTSTAVLSTGMPVRIVGANLPSGLSTGTTYFVRRYDLAGTGASDRLTLHTTRANVAANTKIALGSTGTLGNWYIAPLYVTSVGTNVLNFEFPHLLVTGALLTVVGSNLPTGLSTSTDYYVIRQSARQIGLATSKANAIAGTAITFSGGTVTSFGLSAAANNAAGPYSLNLGNVSAQNSISALYLVGAEDVKANLHVENCKNSIYAYQSQMTIDGGAYANPADDGGNGVLLAAFGLNARVTIQGGPVVSGTEDKRIACVNASILSAAGGTFVTQSSSRTTAQTTGIVQGFSAAATVDIGACDFVYINTSATQITSLSSKHGPRAQVKIVAWGGSIVFATGGNLMLPTATVTLPEKGCAVFELVDTIGTWVLVSKSA